MEDKKQHDLFWKNQNNLIKDLLDKQEEKLKEKELKEKEEEEEALFSSI